MWVKKETVGLVNISSKGYPVDHQNYGVGVCWASALGARLLRESRVDRAWCAEWKSVLRCYNIVQKTSELMLSQPQLLHRMYISIFISKRRQFPEVWNSPTY